jgi:hypothetical protein
MTFLLPGLVSAEIIHNTRFRDDIRTAQVHPVGNPLGYPFIALNSSEKLEFHFDILTTEMETYSFGVLHCDHQWKPDELPYNEYIQGFQVLTINQFDAGFSTMFDYVHYSFSYPDDMSKPRYSGNYAMVVFSGQDIQDRNSWLLTYRFIIYESMVSVNSVVGASSVIAKRFSGQEVDFDIGYKGFTIYDPMKEINVSILQNMNWKSAKTELKPVFLKQDVLTFDYSTGENVFDGGSEWRNFEVKDIRYISAEVSTIMKESDGYHIYLRPDIPEGKRAYATWADLNGLFLIKNDDASDSDLESDYVWVHYQLVMPESLESDVYIEGSFNSFQKQPDKCTYNKQTSAYECTILMKQGYYNYRYFIRDKFYAHDDVSRTEGNYSVTQNDYHIIVYMYDRNLNCDRIIAVKADRSSK